LINFLLGVQAFIYNATSLASASTSASASLVPDLVNIPAYHTIVNVVRAEQLHVFFIDTNATRT